VQSIRTHIPCGDFVDDAGAAHIAVFAIPQLAFLAWVVVNVVRLKYPFRHRPVFEQPSIHNEIVFLLGEVLAEVFICKECPKR
jgi:hypothetical protein